jgi:hypothetical protein
VVAVAVMIAIAGMGIMLNTDRMLTQADKEHLKAIDHFHDR